MSRRERDTVAQAAARERARDARDRIVESYRGGTSLSGIANEYGVSVSWLTSRFDEWQEPRRSLIDALVYRRASARVFRGRMPRRTPDEVRESRAEFVRNRESVVRRCQAGVSAAALAREFHVSPAWVAERLDEWGVPRGRRGFRPQSS